MNPIRNYLNSLGEACRVDGAFPAETAADRLYWAPDPASLSVPVSAGRTVRLVVLHESDRASKLQLDLGEGARLELVEVFAAPATVEVQLTQSAGSTSRITAVQLTGAAASYRTELNAPHAASELRGLFLAGGEEQCTVRLHTAHNAPDCRSESVVKGVAGGTATGRFDGLVYVAPDAQRTDAVQQSRNVLLSDTARIDTLPQLEIYADDVRCSHGATVGQMDDEAVLYMRQRGLSEAAARRLQLEGFAADVVRQCGIDPLGEVLMQAVAEKMGQL